MKKFSLLLCWLLIAGFAQSCKKKKDNPTPSASYQQLLKTWKPGKVLENTLDISASYKVYQITFEEANQEKKFTLVNRQATTLNGTWTISTDQTTITLTFADKTTQTLSSVAFSTNELKYTAEEQAKSGKVNLNFALVPA